MDIISGFSDPMKPVRSRSSFMDPLWIPVWRSMEPYEPVVDLAARITVLLAASLMFVKPSSAEMKESCMPKSLSYVTKFFIVDTETMLPGGYGDEPVCHDPL